MTEALQAQPSRDTAAGVDTLLAEAWACRHESVPRAEALLQQALRAAQSIDYRRGQAYAILRLALCGHMRGQDPQLVNSSLQLALATMRELGDRSGESEALNLSGNLLSRAGRHTEAVQVLRLALALRQALGDQRGESSSLQNIALELQALGRTEEALAHVKQSLAAARACGDLRCAAYAQNTLSKLFRDLGDLPSALKALDQALKDVLKTQDRALECTVRTGQGQTLHELGRTSEAAPCLDAALKLALETGNQGDLIRVHQALGGVELSRGDATRATEHLHLALLAARRAGEVALEPMLLTQQAHAQWARGAVTAAEALASEALLLAQSGSNPGAAEEARRLLTLLGHAGR